MTTVKLTEECRREKEVAKSTWAWEKPAIDGVFDALYKNYSDGKTPDVSQAERTALVDLTETANKRFGLGVDPVKFVNIVIACLPANLPALPKEYDIEKDAQKAGNNEGTMVPYGKDALVPHRTSWRDHLMTAIYSPTAAPGELAKYLLNIPRGTREFWFAHIFSILISILLILHARAVAVETFTQAQNVSPALSVLTEPVLEGLDIEKQGFVKYVSKAFIEGCRSMIPSVLGDRLPATSKVTALTALSSGGIALVALVQNAATEASQLCLQSTYLDAAIAAASGSKGCVQETMQRNLRHEVEKLQGLAGESYNRLYYVTKIAATMGSISTLMIARETMSSTVGLIKYIKKAKHNQLALVEGGKKSRRKSRKKTNKRAHKKPRKSRKKTGSRSHKAGRRKRR